MNYVQKPDSFSVINSIIDTHFNTLKWIGRTTDDLNNKISRLEGLDQQQ